MTRKRVAEQRRKQITSSLYECLASSPYHEITIKDIAKAANVSYGALHYYFESKQDIVRAFVEEFVAENEEKFQHQTAAIGSAWKRLKKLVHILCENMIFNQKTNKVFLNLYHMGNHDDEIRQCLVRSYVQFREAVADIVRYGVSRGEFANVNASEFALFFVGTIEGLYLQETMNPGLCSKKRVEQRLYEIARRHLARREQKK